MSRLKAVSNKAVLVCMLLLTWLIPDAGWAFKTDDQGHGGITRDALRDVSITINGETLKFTDRAAVEVRKANFAVDWHQLAADYHFDDESLPMGSQRINTLRTQVITAAIGGDGGAARTALGGALHTIQDFFAHSNQVNAALPIPNFGSDVLAALPTTTATCLADGATLIPRVGLTTGYFKFGSGLCAPSGKCNHGDHGFCTAGIIKDELTDEQWKNEVPKGVREIFEKVVELGGTISGEHGIGWVQRRYMDIKFPAMHLDLMRGVKAVFDPKGILNPGKIF